MDDFTRANQLLILSAGRRPAWQEPTISDDALNPPASPSDGVALSDAMVAAIKIDLRENVAFRTVRVAFPSVDLAANYTVTLAGTGVTVNGPFADLAELVDDLVTAINADGTVNLILSASPEGTPHDTLLLEGIVAADYSVTATNTGTGTFTFTGDAGSATAVLFAIEHDTTADSLCGDRWALVEGISYTVTPKGLSDRVSCGGYDQLYVQLVTVQRVTNDNSAMVMAPTVLIGPCVAE